VRSVSGLAGAEEAIEYGLRIAGMTLVDEKAREVGAAHELRIGRKSASAFETAVYSHAFKLRSDALGALGAAAAIFAQAFDQHGVLRVHRQAYDVQRVCVPAHRYFDRVDNPKPRVFRRGVRFRQAAQYVVIGERERFHSARRGALDQRGRRQHAVRPRRMAVQIEMRVMQLGDELR
jgi:hypothetical protein